MTKRALCTRVTSERYDKKRGMAGLKMAKVANNVYEVKSRVVSAFIYTTDDLLLCFDAGFNENHVKKGFAELGFEPEDVRYVFLTHTDRDHVGGLNLFKRAELYLSSSEEQMINRSTPRFFGIAFNPPITRRYTLLRDGDVIHAGGARVEALSTPGHTPGSMSYLVNDSTLFVGDALVLRKGKVRPFSRFHLRDVMHMDKTAQSESIRRLARLTGVSLMLTAHTGFTADFEYALSEWA